MATAFMLTDALAEALRVPYRQGNNVVTMSYLINGLKIGEHRILLKRNFDTACWIPPIGKRGSHSIYYGDRMLARVIDRFCVVHDIKDVPDMNALTELAVLREQARIEEASKKSKRPGPAGATPKIQISLTKIFDEKVNWLKDNLPKAKWDELMSMLATAVASYGRHEREHARNTSQDLKKVNRDLRMLGLNFPLFNLFEDSRIEHISRREQGTKFGWMDIEDIAPADNPFNLYLRCIQLEGELDEEALDNHEPFGKTGSRTISNAAESVQAFYQRAVECQTDEHLYPIMAEFMEEFKDEMPEPRNPEEGEAGEDSGSGGSGGGSSSSSGGGGSSSGGSSSSGSGSSSSSDSGAGERAGDLSTAAEAAEEGDSFFDEFDADADVMGGTDEEGREAEEKAKAKMEGGNSSDSKGKSKSQGIAESIEPRESGGEAFPDHFLARNPGVLDAEYAKRVEDVTNRLLQMFRTFNLNQAMEAPGKRMSSRHLAMGEIRYLHRKRFGGKGKRKYVIVYDCSGSMQGRPDREGKVFLLALNNLAKMGYLQGELILSGWVGGRAGWLSYTFPVQDELILRIQPHHNAEGLQDSLRDNLEHLKGVDDVFIYTDAHICDAPLDRDFFARQHVWPVGLYVGDERAAVHMEQHFPQNIIRHTIEELVDVMLTRNRRTVG